MKMGRNEIELEEQLKEVGNRLLNPPSSIDELLHILDKLECLLINVEQAPSRSMQDALLSPMKALISNALLRNSNVDVKVSVASCINEITRITAPDAPYNDDHMKEIFQLTVAAFEKLSHVSSHSYTKAVSILDTVAKVRSCLLMLDLELDELIIKMFQHFLTIIRSNHPHVVFLAMETIMTLIIDESEDVSVGLLTPLLASVRKENQSVSPVAWKLGEKVLTNCVAKLRPYLKEAVLSNGVALDEYASVVVFICQNESLTLDRDHDNGSGDHLVTEGLSLLAASPGEVLQAVDGIPKSTSRNGNALTRNADNVINNNSSKMLEHCLLIQHSESTNVRGDAEPQVKLEMEPGTNLRKRGRKPNSLINPEEGYDHSWISPGRKTAKLPHGRKPSDKGADLSSEDPVTKKVALSPTQVTELTEFSPETGDVLGTSSPSPNQSPCCRSQPKRGRPRKCASFLNQDGDPSFLRLSRVEVLNTVNKEKAPAPAPTEGEVSLRKQSEGRSNSEVKQHKRSRKIGLATKTAEERFLTSSNTLSDKKARFPEEKPVHQSTKEGLWVNKEESLLVKSDTRKRSLVSGLSAVHVAEVSEVKKSKSFNRDRSYEEETPKTNLKRKRTPRKEVSPESADLGEQLLGSRIKVWWPLDKMFYEGVVDSYDPIRRKHRVLYADGDEEVLNLRKQRWELIGDDSLPDQEQETDIPMVDSSRDIPQKGKGKVTSELAKQLKVDLKRSGAASISNRQARTSGRKSAGETMRDEPIVADKAMDSSPRPDGGTGGDGQESARNLNIRSLGTKINSNQTIVGSASPSNDGTPKGGNEFCGARTWKEEHSTEPNRSEQQGEVGALDSADTN